MNLQRLKMPTQILLAASACSMLSACASTRGIAIPTTEPRQLAESIKAYVYIETQNGQRIKSTNRTQLYEGEWVLSDPQNK